MRKKVLLRKQMPLTGVRLRKVKVKMKILLSHEQKN